MATLPKIHKTDRLPLIVGFQPISANTPEQTRVIERGEGIYVYDSTGKEYIEATASFYVASLGYQNEELIEAIERQYRDLPFFVSGLNRTSATSIELAEKLVQMVLLPVFYDSVDVVADNVLFDHETERGAGGFGSTGNF